MSKRDSSKTFLFKERFFRLSISHLVLVVWVGVILVHGYQYLNAG